MLALFPGVGRAVSVYSKLGSDNMKIEKINENQIRCTLTREDLLDRQIKLSELAYGSDKAKTLFRDMMQQAAYEFGFEANNIPLMIEAIPLSAETIILIITKVEDPEELDTRFAQFAPDNSPENGYEMPVNNVLEGADGILDLFQKIKESKKSAGEKKNQQETVSPEEQADIPLVRLYKFEELDTVLKIAAILDGVYDGDNSLYKDDREQEYHLLLSKSQHTPEEFNKICNVLNEYGTNCSYKAPMAAFYREHMNCIIKEKALQKLAGLE